MSLQVKIADDTCGAICYGDDHSSYLKCSVRIYVRDVKKDCCVHTLYALGKQV